MHRGARALLSVQRVAQQHIIETPSTVRSMTLHLQYQCLRVHQPFVSTHLLHRASVAVRSVLTAASHLVAHCAVGSRGHLAQTDEGAEHRDAEVIHGILLHFHDVFQTQAPPHEETEWAYVQRKPRTAKPTPQGLPEGADSTHRISVGDAHHWTAQALEEHPFVLVALADAIVKIVTSASWVVLHALVQLAHIHDGCCNDPEVQNSKGDLNEQRARQSTHVRA